MRVFVSAMMQDVQAVKSIQQLLRSGGHTLTEDWSDATELPPGFDKNRQVASAIAVADINGVLNADAFVILTSNEKSGKGMYTELGAALCRAELGLLDHVLIVGDKRHETVFYFHPKLREFASIEDCVDYLNRVVEARTIEPSGTS